MFAGNISNPEDMKKNQHQKILCSYSRLHIRVKSRTHLYTGNKRTGKKNAETDLFTIKTNTKYLNLNIYMHYMKNKNNLLG